MRIKSLAFASVLALAALAAAAGQARPDVRVVADAAARLRAAASATGRILEKLDMEDSLLILDGKKGSWIKARTAGGAEGWVFDGYLKSSKKPFSRADFSVDEAYEDYLSLASRNGERVRASEDYEKVKKGDLGRFFSYAEGDLPFLIVWDRDLDATPSEEYLGAEFPRILSYRVYFVEARILEIVGEAAVADFSHEALEFAKAKIEEFGPGATVRLGRHLAVSAGEGSENWNPEMEQYVGHEAKIASLEGLDEQGRPIARVDIDDGDWFWRIENMTLASPSDGEEAEAYPDDEGIDAAAVEASPESYGKVAVGSFVLLGRHDDPSGDANWNDSMDEYVGKSSKVLELCGPDNAGFLCVRVEGNDWYWRVRNLALVNVGEAGSYGFAVGDEVVLGKHREIGGEANWADEMDEYVGMRARITELVGAEGDGAECFTVRVDVDGGDWAWRAESLTPAR
jgi:hypothetical protein